MQGAIRDSFFKLADHAQYQEVYKPDEFWIYLIRKRFSNDYNGLLNNLDNTSFNRAMGELHNSILPIKKAQTSDGGGFVCYWAGRGGKLWRISDCWLDHYDELKEWSNVACVNWKRAPTLAARMEARFLQTIQDYEYLQKQLYGQVSR